MQAATLSHPQRVITQALTFRRRLAPDARWAVSRNSPVARVGGLATSVHDVDTAIAALAAQQGHTAADVASVRLTVLLQSDASERLQRTLMFKVTRDRDDETFTAECELPGFWGHGETFGEAFLDCLEDLSARSQILMRDRGRLGPALELQAEAIERWMHAVE
jgi:hypothetical protein